MTIYTIGFAQKNAKTFFELLKKNNIEIVVDIRLNNKSQLAGFTKGNDLSYFLGEICNCEYQHCIDFAPTKDILDNYKKKGATWSQYVEQFLPLMEKRKATELFLKMFGKYNNVCLLCSEPTPEQCHRRLLAELIQQKNSEVLIKHL
jgi:uncharacterized protein (DUF488 family)